MGRRWINGLAARRSEVDQPDVVIIAYTAPGSQTEALGWGKPVYTFERPHNANLMAAGARAVVPEHLIENLAGGIGDGHAILAARRPELTTCATLEEMWSRL